MTIRNSKGLFVKGCHSNPETEFKKGHNKGMTFEAIYGIEKTKKLKENLSLFNKGKKVSIETRRKISLLHKGKKQKPFSDKHRKNMSLSRKGMKLSVEHRKNISIARKGMKFSKQHIENMCKARIKVIQNQKHYPNWKGGITPINTRIRNGNNFIEWRKMIFKRDDYTCQECRDRSGNGHAVTLNAHHIKSFSKYPLLRFDVNNGITLCEECHNETKKDEWWSIQIILSLNDFSRVYPEQQKLV